MPTRRTRSPVSQQTSPPPAITRAEGRTTVTDKLSYDMGSGVLSFTDERAFGMGEDARLRTKATGDSSGVGRAEIGADYSKDGLTAKGDAWADTQGRGGVSAALSKELDDGWLVGGDAALSYGQDPSFRGSAFAQRTDDEGDRLRAGYSYNSVDNAHTVDLLAEETMGDLKLRGSASYEQSDRGKALDLNLGGAYFLNEDVATIAGARVKTDFMGEVSYIPQAGVQVMGVPLVVGYDMKNERIQVGISLSF